MSCAIEQVWNTDLTELPTFAASYAKRIKFRLSHDLIALLAEAYELEFKCKLFKCNRGIPYANNENGAKFYSRVFRTVPKLRKDNQLDKRSYLSNRIIDFLEDDTLCDNCKCTIQNAKKSRQIFDCYYDCYKILEGGEVDGIKCKNHCKNKHLLAGPALRFLALCYHKDDIIVCTAGHASGYMNRVKEVFNKQIKAKRNGKRKRGSHQVE